MREPAKLRVAVIVPAYNEEARIANVLRAATQAKLVDEIIVVSDGSIDRTSDVARQFAGVRVIDLAKNVGKGAAMVAGVAATQAEIVAFCDADLLGLRGDHIDAILRPIVSNNCDMCVGIFRGGKFWSDTAQKFAPHISGQRAMKRWLFEGVPHMTEMRMGVEICINAHVKRAKARVLRVILRGVANYHKEQKLGLVRGSKARIQMYGEIATAMVRMRRRRRRR